MVPLCRRVMDGGRKLGHHGRLPKEMSEGRGLCRVSQSYLAPGCLHLSHTSAII